MTLQDIEGAYGLSATQKGMLFHTAYSPRSGVYVQQMMGQLHEPLNALAFRRAWQQIVERHAVLRTSFSLERCDEPLQQVHQHVVLPFEEQDWRGLSDPEQERRLKDFLAADRRVGFDLARAPLMRLALFHLRDADYRLVWTSHHALLDGRSRRIVLEELFALYEACSRGEKLPLAPAPPFKAHIDWLARQDFSHAENFWRRELEGVKSPTPSGIDSRGIKSADGDESHGSRTLRLSSSLTASLNKMAERHRLTLNTLLQGAWALVLSRYSGRRDILFGATRVCRHSPVEGADSMVGLLINTVPVRVNVSEERDLLPWLEELRAKWITVREYEQTPLSKIQEWSEVPGSTPLFESLLVFENFELNAALRARGRGFERREFQLIGRTNYPLTISGYRDQQLLVKVDYHRSRFQDDSIARLLAHIESVLSAMVSNPRQRIADVSILTETERQRMLVEWNNTKTEYPREKCIHELFEQQVERTPTAIAVDYEERQLTYGQLNRQANQLAHYLRKRGIGPDCLVGICMERSSDLIVAMLGVLKTGGAYVPLDPSYPRARLEFMLADTRMTVLVTDKQGLEHLPGSQAEVVCLNSDSETITRECDQNPRKAAQPDSLAYVIYTSGSTGQPKGVAVPHRAVSRLVCNTNYAQLRSCDRVAQVSNCSFDAATFEIWGALLQGACLVGVAKEVVLSARHFATEIRDREISTLFLTTSLFNQLASEIPQAFKTVTHLLFGGEAADPHWVREILNQGPPRRLVNGYGPTESTTFACWHLTQQVQADAVTIPIGRPISNTQVYLLDARLRPVPPGVTGQLYIGGDGLARCYLNRPELTAESFVPHPFSTEPGARLYRTGDLVRYLPDGNMEFLGRADQQVKIRGFRIELGEIETALHQHSSVRQAVVLVDEGLNSTKSLTGYIVTQKNEPLLASQLRNFLMQKVPEYMVPTNFVLLDSLPLTPNGKLDRNGLLTLRSGSTQTERRIPLVTPQNHTEEALVRILRQVLGKESIGIHDSFFDLGGNSLLAMQVISNVWRSLGVDLPMRQLFDAPTVARLAETISNDNSKSRQLPGMPLRASHRSQHIPVSARQKFCWDHKDTFVDKPVFNISRILRLRGVLQKDALQCAFNDLIARHESLRTSFSLSPSGDLVQVIQLNGEATLSLVDLSNVATPDREKKARSLVEEEGLIVFRLGESPLLRLKLIRLSQDEHWLVLVISHFVADGWSLNVLFRELATIYTAYCRNEKPDLPVLSIQFADYVLWQRHYLRSEREKLVSYWKCQLGGDLRGLRLPFDYPRPKTPTLRGRRETVVLSTGVRDSLSQLGKQQKATEFMVLLAAFKALLYLYTGQVDIVTGASDANRSDIETTDVIGLFTNIILFRSNLSGNPTFLELLNRVRNVVLDSYQYRGFSLELLEPECRRDDSNGDPMHQCRFLEAPDSRLKVSMEELEVEFLPREQRLMRSDVSVFVGHTDKGVEIRWDYSTDLFRPETVHLMMQRYRSLLQQIILNPNQRLSDFSLDSLDKGHSTPSWEAPGKVIQAAGCGTQPDVLATPNNHTEEALLHIWRQVLRKEEIGIHDNFFDLGGNSLLAMQVISNVWRSLGVDLPVRQLFDAATVGGLAEIIKRQEPEGRDLQEMPLKAAPRSQEIPVSRRQEFYLSVGMGTTTGTLNICRILRLRGSLQTDILQLAFNDLIARHESLRTGFEFTASGRPIQVIHPERTIALPLVDLGSLAPLDKMKEARRFAEEQGTLAFRLAEDPLLRVSLLRISQDEHWLVLVIHHLVTDGWSLKVLFEELGRIYTAYSRGERPDLAPLPIQFADYALWERQDRQVEWDLLVSYWKRRLEGNVTGLKLPLDRARPKTATLGARRETVFLQAPLQKAIPELGRARQATQFMVLLTAFQQLLHLYTGQIDIVVGTWVANRNHPETVGVIGFFSNLILLRSDLSGNPTFLELLTRVRNAVLEGNQYQGPTLELFNVGNWQDDSSADPRHQCRFNEAPDSGLEPSMGELEVEFLPREQCLLRGDLRVFVAYTDKGVEVRWDYNSYLFTPETIHLMLQRYQSLLQQIVLDPNKRLSDFSLDSLDKKQQTRFCDHNTRETRETLIRIWTQVLGKEEIGIHDNFFDLGGNSLLAMQVISNVWRSLGVDLPVRRLFDAPTVAGLAECIRQDESEGRQLQVIPLMAVPRNQEMPPSLAQQRALIDKSIVVEKGAGNIGRILRLRGTLQIQALQRALNDLIARHESLRTSFMFSETGKPLQRIHTERRISISTIDLGRLAPLDREKEARRLAEEETLRVFAVAESPLLRVTILRLSEDEHWMVSVIHHLVADGWSLKVLFQELSTIYTAHCRDEKPDLPELPIQFGDYAFWQRQYLQGEPRNQLVSYWKQRLSGKLSSLKLPFDHPRPKLPTFRARRETVFLPGDLQKSLSGLGQGQHATEFMVELAAFNLLLHLYSGQTDILVGTPIANRNQVETVNVIGCFVDTVLCRSDLSGNPTFVELVTRIRNVVLEACQHQALPYLEVVKLVNWRGKAGSTPNHCSFSEAPDANLGAAMEGLEVETLPREQMSMTSDLRVVLGHTDKGIEMRWDYSVDLFKSETIHLMVQRYHSLLEQCVLNPNRRLSDFSLDSLNRSQQMLCRV